MLREIRGRQISPRVATLTPAEVRLCHGYGIEVRAWGIRGLWEMHHALRCGVDGVPIDFPDVLSRVLGRPQRPRSAESFGRIWPPQRGYWEDTMSLTSSHAGPHAPSAQGR